jgi:hypothetical protein
MIAKQIEILDLEFEITKIFNQETIKMFDVVRANKLLQRWKELTNHKEATSNPILDYVDILDEQPNKKIWER